MKDIADNHFWAARYKLFFLLFASLTGMWTIVSGCWGHEYDIWSLNGVGVSKWIWHSQSPLVIILDKRTHYNLTVILLHQPTISHGPIYIPPNIYISLTFHQCLLWISIEVQVKPHRFVWPLIYVSNFGGSTLKLLFHSKFCAGETLRACFDYNFGFPLHRLKACATHVFLI